VSLLSSALISRHNSLVTSFYPHILTLHPHVRSVFAHIRKSAGAGVLRLKLKGNDLKNTEGFMRKSDPFFELSRRIDSAGGLTWDNVFRSSVVKDDLSPQWQESAIELSLLCGGDLDTPILLTVYDHESDGKHKAMGKAETTVNGLVRAAANRSEVTLVGGKKGKEAGHVLIQKADIVGVEIITDGVQKLAVSTPSAPAAAANAGGQPSFVDYVSGGCNLNVCVAIDFTGSNGTCKESVPTAYVVNTNVFFVISIRFDRRSA